jgi:signal transduction histidine kinase
MSRDRRMREGSSIAATKASAVSWPTPGMVISRRQAAEALVIRLMSASIAATAVTMRADPDGVLVAVQDSGPGFTPESADRLFEASYTTKLDGLGIGLSICRSIIEARDGRLWAIANVPEGAVFQFTLPAYQFTDGGA